MISDADTPTDTQTDTQIDTQTLMIGVGGVIISTSSYSPESHLSPISKKSSLLYVLYDKATGGFMFVSYIKVCQLYIICLMSWIVDLRKHLTDRQLTNHQLDCLMDILYIAALKEMQSY